MLSNKPEGSPGRDHEGNQQREEHRRRGPHWNGTHVRAHQAADEGHWQYRRNHGEGSQNGRVAHLGDRFDCDFTHRPAVAFREPEVPHHVLNDNDGVVYENADAEDQSEERYAIDRVAEKIEDRHGECEGDWYSQQDDSRLTPTQKERNQQSYR